MYVALVPFANCTRFVAALPISGKVFEGHPPFCISLFKRVDLLSNEVDTGLLVLANGIKKGVRQFQFDPVGLFYQLVFALQRPYLQRQGQAPE